MLRNQRNVEQLESMATKLELELYNILPRFLFASEYLSGTSIRLSVGKSSSVLVSLPSSGKRYRPQ